MGHNDLSDMCLLLESFRCLVNGKEGRPCGVLMETESRAENVSAEIRSMGFSEQRTVRDQT